MQSGNFFILQIIFSCYFNSLVYWYFLNKETTSNDTNLVSLGNFCSVTNVETSTELVTCEKEFPTSSGNIVTKYFDWFYVWEPKKVSKVLPLCESLEVDRTMGFYLMYSISLVFILTKIVIQSLCKLCVATLGHKFFIKIVRENYDSKLLGMVINNSKKLASLKQLLTFNNRAKWYGLSLVVRPFGTYTRRGKKWISNIMKSTKVLTLSSVCKQNYCNCYC